MWDIFDCLTFGLFEKPKTHKKLSDREAARQQNASHAAHDNDTHEPKKEYASPSPWDHVMSLHSIVK